MKRKSNYDRNRACYLSSDGKFYCYETWDSDARQMVTQKLEVGKDLTEEWTIFLDESDHEMGLNERYQDELRDPRFDEGLRDRYSDEDIADSMDIIGDCDTSPERILFKKEESENPDAAQVRRIIEEDCTKEQQDLFYSHFGEARQLEELRQEEAKETGKLPSPQAMTNRKNKIIDKVAKALGTERIKRHASPKKD